jgi:hypothetical protein
VVGAWTGLGRGGWLRRLIEGDAETYLDLPARDADLLDDDAHQALSSCEVELVDPGRDGLGEVADPLAQTVVRGQLRSLGHELLALGLQACSTCLEFVVAASQFEQVEQSGLVDVEKPLALAVGVVELALQARHLSGEELIVGDRFSADDGGLAGGEQFRSKHGVADLVEHEGIKLLSADLALSATPVRSSGRNLVVVGAAVIVVVTAAAGGCSGATALDAAGSADDQTP